MQVYAISSEAKDVRSVVTQLNAKRGEPEEPAVTVESGQARAATSPAKCSTAWSDYLTDDQVASISTVPHVTHGHVARSDHGFNQLSCQTKHFRPDISHVGAKCCGSWGRSD